MTLQEAHAADAEQRIEEAADLYERAISVDRFSVDDLIELLVLYWQATDYGFWTNKGLDPHFVSMAGKRLRELLDLGRVRFPGSPAILFWSKYIAWADLAEPFDVEECRVLLRAHPEYLEPAMFLFAASQGLECEEQAQCLLAKCKGSGTSRCRYIVSVIEGVVNRKHFTQK